MTRASSLEAALREAVDCEPELPGDMPEHIWLALQQGRKAAAFVLRGVVQATKKNIRERIDAALSLPAEEASGQSEGARDRVAEFLSVVRYAYASGFRDGNQSGRFSNSELLYAASESQAIDYVAVREQNERHPVAILAGLLSHPSAESADAGDARRYRYLRTGEVHFISAPVASMQDGRHPHVVMLLPGVHPVRVVMFGEGMDAAIDQAIKDSAAGEKA